jgi:DNA-directed RNA polymerase subunit RPC12/RpoP|tara:strand:- start:44152 stop:44481 length:330 start_codon:yes stop_codon:yes gene_type:complete
MKVTYQEGKLSVQLECDSQKELFTQLAQFQEVFSENKCGKCGSENLRFVVRENDGNEYYELRCLDCGAKLAFGVMKKGGGLFPRRKDSDGNWLPDRGWTKWNPKTKSVE